MNISSGLVAAGLCLLASIAASRAASRKQAQTIAPSHELQSDQHGTQLQQCIDFLKQHMPDRDQGRVSQQLLVEHAQLALQARQSNAWAAEVPWDIFLNDVLAYRNLDEPLDDFNWRVMFHQKFAPIVAQAESLAEAAQILNRDIWGIWGLHFVPDKSPEIMSPGQVLKAGFASCTGLSIFLANACRAVGVPARVAGTPSWVTDRRDAGDRFNNHNWVEIWDGSSWSFTGACEYNAAGLNRTWFFPQPAKAQLPGDHWHAIYAASFAPTGTVFPLAWAPDDNTVAGIDVTQAYLDAEVLPTQSAGAIVEK